MSFKGWTCGSACSLSVYPAEPVVSCLLSSFFIVLFLHTYIRFLSLPRLVLLFLLDCYFSVDSSRLLYLFAFPLEFSFCKRFPFVHIRYVYPVSNDHGWTPRGPVIVQQPIYQSKSYCIGSRWQYHQFVVTSNESTIFLDIVVQWIMN